MSYKCLLFSIVTVLLFSCRKENSVNTPQPPITRAPKILLKEIVIPHLPSPYYHFTYDTAGNVIFASFASGLFMYNIVYSGGRIIEMNNNIVVNRDRLQYLYDNAGRAVAVNYADSAGAIYTKINFTYDGQKLVKLERRQKRNAGFSIDKTMTFLYHPDGNLQKITKHRPTFDGQDETTQSDQFEQYDEKENTDGFSLIHDEFFDHVVLLPGVQFQKNNPQKLTHTGNGINYQITYTYSYNDRDAPLIKTGEGIWLNGPQTGKQFTSTSVFSYY